MCLNDPWIVAERRAVYPVTFTTAGLGHLLFHLVRRLALGSFDSVGWPSWGLTGATGW